MENGVTTTYDYTLHGKLITHMVRKTGGTVDAMLHFFYDTNSRLTVVEYSGVKYRYVHNLQGDIVGILDSSGALVVEYKYDAWGKPLSITRTLKTTLGELNPFRYRGYVYDEETRMYWLKDRYYYSKHYRFISADNIYASIGDLGSANRYTYCRNAPILLEDGDGDWPSLSSIFAGIAAAAIVVATVAAAVVVAAPVLAGVGITAVSTAVTIAKAAVVTSAVSAGVATVAAVYEQQPREYTVYGLADPATNEIQYIGRTKNYEQRMRIHRSPTSRTNKLVPRIQIDNLTYAEARGLEEMGMVYYHTRKFLNEQGENLIRGIGPRNKNATIYRAAASRRCSYLYNKLYQIVICVGWKEIFKMGTWGHKLYDNDVALDVKDDIEDILAEKNDDTAINQILTKIEQEYRDDEDKGIAWIAAADCILRRGTIDIYALYKSILDGNNELSNEMIATIKQMLQNKDLRKKRRTGYKQYKTDWNIGDVYLLSIVQRYAHEVEFSGYNIGFLCIGYYEYRGKYPIVYIFCTRNSIVEIKSNLSMTILNSDYWRVDNWGKYGYAYRAILWAERGNDVPEERMCYCGNTNISPYINDEFIVCDNASLPRLYWNNIEMDILRTRVLM